jgi:hypothetical protein
MYSYGGHMYWDSNCDSSAEVQMDGGSSLWTDGGTFTYLTSTTDDLVLGASTTASSKFFFDVSEGRLGIGTDTPQAAIDIAGASSTISNTSGDITITPNANLIVSQGNVGIGTTSPSSKLFVLPSTSSETIFATKSLQSTAPLGSELVSNGTFADNTVWTWGTGWAHDAANLEADHTTGNTAALTQSISVTNGSTYQVSFDIKNRTAGSVTFDVGGVYIYDYGSDTTLEGGDTTRSFVASGTTGSQTLSITPSSDFDGSVDNVSVKAITGVSQPNVAYLDDSGDTAVEIRGDYGLFNTFIGRDSGRGNTTGNYNTFLGRSSGYNNTTGSRNTFLGMNSGFYNTTGSNNTFLGMYSGYNNTTSNYNTFLGSYSGYSNTIGYYNAFLGRASGYDNTEGYSNTMVGYNTGRGITTGDKNTILGANVTGLSADLSNNVIIADGDGNQRIRIDSSGNVGIGTTSPGALLETSGTSSGGNILNLALRNTAEAVDSKTNIYFMTGSGSPVGTNITAFIRSEVTQADPSALKGNLKFYTNNGDMLSTAMTIDDAGKVGIGTTSPGQKLDVAGTGKFGDYALIGSNISAGYYQDSANGAYRANGTTGDKGYFFQAYAGNNTIMYVGLNGSYAGRVGIGTTGPRANLNVNKGIAIGGGTGVSTTDGGRRSLQFLTDTAYGGTYNAHSGYLMYSTMPGGWGSAKLHFARSTNWGTYDSTPTMTLSGNKVGIGTTSPASLLDVFMDVPDPNMDRYFRFSSDTTGWASDYIIKAYGDTEAGDGILELQSDHAAVNDRYSIAAYQHSYLRFKCGLAGACYADGGWNGNADFAEYFYTYQKSLEPGDIVKLSQEEYKGEDKEHIAMGIVEQAKLGDQPLGVISTNAGFIGALISEDINDADNYRNNPNYKVVGISGQIPVKVVLNPGQQIDKTDSITLSNIPKYGTKVVKDGYIIGNAIESTKQWNEQNCPKVSSIESIKWPEDNGANDNKPCFRLPDGKYVGKIMIYLRVSYYYEGEDLFKYTESNELLTVEANLSTENNKYDLGTKENRWKNIYSQESIQIGKEGNSGSIKYDTETNTIQFSNDGTNWISLGEATKTITLSAEYEGAVLAGDGNDNRGVMTSDSEGTESKYMNYYKWTSNQPLLQDYDVRVRFTLPNDFESWSNNAIKVSYSTETTNKEISKLDLYLFEQNSETVDTQNIDLISEEPGKWSKTTINSENIEQCNKAGDTCILVIRGYSSDDHYVKVGDIQITYRRKL